MVYDHGWYCKCGYRKDAKGKEWYNNVLLSKSAQTATEIGRKRMIFWWGLFILILIGLFFLIR